MSDIEEAVYSRLVNHAGTTALVGTRVKPQVLDQNTTYPAISFSRISTNRQSAMGSDVPIARAMIQISCWGEDYPDSKDVAAQVRAAMQRWRGTVAGVTVHDTYIENEIDLHDPETNKYFVAIDCLVIFGE